jgi:hypothetical protein
MHRGTFKQAALAVSTVLLATRIVSPGLVKATDLYYDCVVVEHLYLTKQGYRPHPHPYPQLGSHLVIDKQSGVVQGPVPSLEWERIRVVKTSPDYNVFMTRGYGADGTPVQEVIVSKRSSGETLFVSIDLLTNWDLIDGTCK